MHKFLMDCLKYVLPFAVVVLVGVTTLNTSNRTIEGVLICALFVGSGVFAWLLVSQLIYPPVNKLWRGHKIKQANKQLEGLATLRQSGVITAEQFNTRKEELGKWVAE